MRIVVRWSMRSFIGTGVLYVCLRKVDRDIIFMESMPILDRFTLYPDISAVEVDLQSPATFLLIVKAILSLRGMG